MLSDRLKELLIMKNFTPASLAKITGLSKGYIGDILKNRSNGGEKFYSTLESTLNVNTKWLKYGEGTMFLNEEQEYSNLIKFIKEAGLSEEEAIKIIANHLKSPPQQILETFISASKGDKTSISKIRQYLDSLEALFD